MGASTEVADDQPPHEPTETAANLADVDALLDLLDLIHWPDLNSPNDREFWEEVAAGEGWDANYATRKLAYFIEQLDSQRGSGTVAADAARQLASYCLSFFDGNRPRMWAAVGGAFEPVTGEILGRRWAAAVCDAAWKVYVPLAAAQSRGSQPLRRKAHTIWKLREGI